MKPYRVEIEVMLEPGTKAVAVVYVESTGSAGAEVAALEAMAYRMRVKSVEVQA